MVCNNNNCNNYCANCKAQNGSNSPYYGRKETKPKNEEVVANIEDELNKKEAKIETLEILNSAMIQKLWLKP
jgi:hypothetical protein